MLLYSILTSGMNIARSDITIVVCRDGEAFENVNNLHLVRKGLVLVAFVKLEDGYICKTNQYWKMYKFLYLKNKIVFTG